MKPDAISTINGKPYFDEEIALAQLLLEGVLFSNCRPYMEREGDPFRRTVVLFVLCNDIFAWACADAEDLPYKEIEPLYRLVLEYPTWGAAIWCAKRRNEKPQAPAVKLMKQANAWPPEMDLLGPNWYDAYIEKEANENPKLR